MMIKPITATVAKMGDTQLVNVTSTNLKLGMMVELKPKGVNIRALKRVVRQGDRKVIIIPKMYRAYFKHGSEVIICRKKKTK
jgi:DNA mismatch repair protein MutH